MSLHLAKQSTCLCLAWQPAGITKPNQHNLTNLPVSMTELWNDTWSTMEKYFFLRQIEFLLQFDIIVQHSRALSLFCFFSNSRCWSHLGYTRKWWLSTFWSRQSSPSSERLHREKSMVAVPWIHEATQKLVRKALKRGVMVVRSKCGQVSNTQYLLYYY